MIIDAEYENGDVSEIKSRCVKVVDPKEIIVDMITQLIQGVDEELVQSTAEMLELKKWVEHMIKNTICYQIININLCIKIFFLLKNLFFYLKFIRIVKKLINYYKMISLE